MINEDNRIEHGVLNNVDDDISLLSQDSTDISTAEQVGVGTDRSLCSIKTNYTLNYSSISTKFD